MTRNPTYEELVQRVNELESESALRGRVEDRLRKSEDRFRYELLSAHSRDIIFFIRRDDGCILEANAAAVTAYGYSHEELLCLSIRDLRAPTTQPLVADQMAKADAEGILFETVHRRKDGSHFPVEVSSQGATIDGVRALISVVRDISERKRAEAEISSLARFPKENPNPVMRISVGGELLYANDAATVLLQAMGWDKGSRVPEALLLPVRRAGAEGTKLDFEWPCPSLNRVYSFGLSAGSETDEVNLYGRDITEEIQAEEERLQMERRIQRNQRLESLGTLAGGIAHDFNNLLMGIQGRVSLMGIEIDPDHPWVDHLKGIEACVKSAADLTRQLLGFARGGKYEVKATDLNKLIEQSAGMFGRTRKDTRIHTQFDACLWTVEVDRRQIEQVLLNLFVNASQAMPGGGQLYLQTQNVTLDEEYARQHEVQAGRYVKISVTDTGIGMDETTLSRLFEPFFTTKGMGRGTGLGLASAFGIIKNHCGVINAYSEVGHGTTFNIYLPASEKAVEKEAVKAKLLSPGTETILLVDDEQVVIEVCRQMLEKLGYRILVALSGKEALEIYKADKDQIDLVILDLIMPDMGGGEVFDGLKAIDAHVQVLLASGYSISGQAEEILSRGCRAFIQKPFTIAVLSESIRKVLGAPEE